MKMRSVAATCLERHTLLSEKLLSNVFGERSGAYILLTISSYCHQFCYKVQRCELEAIYACLIARLPVSKDGVFPRLLVIAKVSVVDVQVPGCMERC